MSLQKPISKFMVIPTDASSASNPMSLAGNTSFTRRCFLKHSLIGTTGLLAPAYFHAATAKDFLPMTSASPTLSARQPSWRYDLVIAGAGTGGVAAALAAARLGRRVLLTEETDWIGGQLTSQGVPPDENPWIELFGCTRSYRRFRNGVRDYYRRNFPLTAAARAREDLNPGNGAVSKLCHLPRVGLAVLEAMLAPHIAAGTITLLPRHHIHSVQSEGDFVIAAEFMNEDTGHLLHVEADYFLDATELGDLLPRAGCEFVTGAESRRETGEPHGVDGPAQPLNMQAISHCFAIDYRHGENHVIDKPDEYEFWKQYRADFWPDRHLSWKMPNPRTLEPQLARVTREKDQRLGDLFAFRRIQDRDNFTGAFNDISLVNWVQMDYWLGPVVGVDAQEAQRNRERARQLSLSLLYWMQTEAPTSDGEIGYPGMRLRHDVFGTEDGLARYPYIRESRRIRAVQTIVEQNLASDVRGDHGAVKYRDSVGIGWYRIDLHPSTGGNNYIDIGSCPFQIPLGALIPQRMQNLLPACKNLGTTHITNGCYRLHPVEWNIGESAGALAAFCVEHKVSPRKVHADSHWLGEFQALLVREGIDLDWPAGLKA
jgi:hypothetical protein